MRRRFPAPIGLLLVLSAGCRRVDDSPGGPANPPKAPAGGSASSSSPSSRAARSSARSLDAIRNMGYLGYAAEPVTDDRKGVVLFDEQRSCPGYNLYVIHSKCRAELIDARGRVIQAWQHPGRYWARCRLLPDGDLIVVGADRDSAEGRTAGDSSYVLRMSWDGRVLRKFRALSHHDAEITPRNELLVLTRRVTFAPEFGRTPIRDNLLSLFTVDGRTIGQLSLYDLFTKAGIEFQKFTPDPSAPVPSLDLFHANAVEWMYQPHLAEKSRLYGPDNVLVTIRHQDMVAIVNWERKKLVWWWGPGELSGPHDGAVLPGGNILIFDNGLNRSWSRVVELDPLEEKIVWEYRAPRPEDFYSATRGSSQRLPNGNTLIANSDHGELFEIAPDGRRVWHYLCPHVNPEGRRATIVRVRHYDPSYVEAIMKRFETARRYDTDAK